MYLTLEDGTEFEYTSQDKRDMQIITPAIVTAREPNGIPVEELSPLVLDVFNQVRKLDATAGR